MRCSSMATWLGFLGQLTKLQSQAQRNRPALRLWANMSSILFASLAFGRRSLWPVGGGAGDAGQPVLKVLCHKNGVRNEAAVGPQAQNQQSTLKARPESTGMRNKY